MREETRRVIRAVLKRERDPAMRQWFRFMLRGERPVTRPRRKRKAPARSPAAPSPKVRTRKR
jgi:hypothetical protein